MIVTVYLKNDGSDEILMTKKEFEKMMESINKEIEAAYDRGHKDGRNSVSITPSTTPPTTPTITPWWENPFCKTISGGDSSISVKLGVNNEM